MAAPVRRTRLFALAVLAAGLAVPSHAAGAWGLTRYDFDATPPLADAAFLPSWAAALARARTESAQLDACEADAAACPPHLRAWRHVVHNARALDADRRIELANRFVNRRAWDMERRRADDWRTLTEFLRRGGDCEDFAFAKYQVLRTLGFAPEDLRVVIAFDRQTREHHALLAIRGDSGTRLLDVVGRTYGARAAPTYRFLYAMNERSVWDHTRTDTADAARAGTALSINARTFNARGGEIP